MHLTRPKSSKGRSRSAANSIQGPPVSPDPAECSRLDRNLRSQSQPIMWQAGHLSQDGVLHTPAAPPQSLNKYKVLPSIERRPSEVSPGRSLDKHMSKLSLSGDAVLRHEEPDLHTVTKTSSSEVDKRADPDAGPIMTAGAGASGSLLLAVRAPCGRRFQQQFDPTDPLLMVRTSAEVRYGAKYEDASIETMDVPRRTFTDMDMTLAQCGILNRSVLCISQNDSVEENE